MRFADMESLRCGQMAGGQRALMNLGDSWESKGNQWLIVP